jgi:Zn-dependent peptidase ImmA (M78 family)
MGGAQPSIKAKEIIRSLRIENPSEIHVKDIAMEFGALVREKYLEGSEARLLRKGSYAIITLNSSIREEGRKRFAIAHEIGHLKLHTNSQLVFCSETDMCVWQEDKQQEAEANEFASSLLMPEFLFIRSRKVEQPNLNTVVGLAGEFRTTLTATALRYVQLSIEPCAVVISRDRIIRWYRKSADFDFHVKVGDTLSPFTYASSIFKGINPPVNPERVPADAWIAGDIDQEAEIFEHSLSISSYNVVLSLLWINEEIRGNFRQNDDNDNFDMTNSFTRDQKRWRW